MKLIIFISFFILKSGYICHVKFKRIIALNLIFIVILSSIGYCGLISSQDSNNFKSSIKQFPSSTQLIADTQDPAHEFREGFKTNQATQTGTTTYPFLFEASQFTFKSIRSAQYCAYLKKQLIQRSPSKLFLDFKSLII